MSQSQHRTSDNFTHDNLLWVYDREKCEYRGQQPHNTAVIGRFYEVEGTDGGTYLGIEDFLSELENRAAPAINVLERGGSLNPEPLIQGQSCKTGAGTCGVRMPVVPIYGKRLLWRLSRF